MGVRAAGERLEPTGGGGGGTPWKMKSHYRISESSMQDQSQPLRLFAKMKKRNACIIE